MGYSCTKDASNMLGIIGRQQCETCTRRNIPLDAVRCPACGGVDLRGYDPGAPEENVQAEMLRALKRAAPWLGKMIADGAHQNAVLPQDCVRTLAMVEAAIERAEPATAAATPATPATPARATIHGPECPGDCEVCENDADGKARTRHEED